MPKAKLINLIDFRFRKTIDRNTPYEHAFNNLYWQVAGIDHATGKKNKLMTNFEDRYKTEFISYMEEYNTINLWTKFKNLNVADQENVTLKNVSYQFDLTAEILC